MIEYLIKSRDAYSEKVKIIPKESFQLEYPTSIDIESLKNRSPAEVMKISKITTLTEKALVICFYLWKVREIDRFNSNDLSNIFSEAGQPRLSNPNDVLYRLKKRGFLRETAEKDGLKAFDFTLSGSEYVEKILQS